MNEDMESDIEDKLLSLSLDKAHKLSDAEIYQFRDLRGFNLLMLAAEAGRIDVVQHLIDRGEDVDAEFEGESAINLAYAAGHHEVVLLLLRANAKFPSNSNFNSTTDELKSFVDLSKEMHERVRKANDDDLENLMYFLRQSIDANPSLRFFYHPQDNYSLLKRAIVCKNFSIYEFLFSLNILLAPHESMDDITQNFSNEEREFLKKRVDPEFNHILTLMSNCKVELDCKENRLLLVRNALQKLFMIPAIAIVLKIVAASRNFKIIFDFNRDSVTFLDPKSEPYTSDWRYYSRKIYIGAKDLLHQETAFKFPSVIAHELTHYAMFLVYNNFGNPYNEKNSQACFNAISDECKRLKDAEEIVGLVYDCYDEDMWHAELIVRVPQLCALYVNDNQKSVALRETFNDLFDYYEQTCMPQMEAELPRIERKFLPFKEIEEKAKKQNIWISILIILITFGSLFLIIASHWYSPVLWSDLSIKERNFIKNSKVEFYDVEVKFGELFANDSNVFGLLSSEQIKKTLTGETEELSKALNETLHHQAFLTWSNMTKEFKEKFLTREVDFQGQKVSIGNLTKNEKIFKLLNSEEVRKIFTSENFKISLIATEEKSKIFIERFFTEENLKVWSEDKYNRIYKYYNNNDHLSDIIQKFYANGKVNTENSNVKSFDQIMNEIQSSKVFLLSSAAGDGKSTTFRHFSLKFKEKFPRKWIQFVDLKKHFEAFDTAQQLDLKDFEVLTIFLGEKVLSLESFELELFKELFASGDVIFLWDGVDEIFPKLKNFMLDLTENISRTQNFQFISTRPQHSKDFEEKLKVKAQKLIPFSELDRFEFLVKTIADLKFNETGEEIFDELKHFYNQSYESFEDLCLQQNVSKYLKTISKVQRIYDFNEPEDSFLSNPLLILMICEISCDNSFEVHEQKFNSFQLFETFVIRKLGIVNRKGEIVNSKRHKALQTSSSINIWQVHQFFALDLLAKASNLSKFGEEKFSDIIEYKIKKSLSSFTSEQISRFGILQVNSETDFDFVHRSFAEFFVSQFFLDNLLLSETDLDLNRKEDKWKIFGFFAVWVNDECFYVRAFLLEASEIEKYSSKFFAYWNKQTETNKRFFGDTKMLEMIQFSSYFGMENFDFASDYKKCRTSFDEGDIFKNLSKIEAFLGKKFIVSILNFRTVGNIATPFLCSFLQGSDEDFLQFLKFGNEVLSTRELLLLITQAQESLGENVLKKLVGNKKVSYLDELITSLSQTRGKRLTHLNHTVDSIPKSFFQQILRI